MIPSNHNTSNIQLMKDLNKEQVRADQREQWTTARVEYIEHGSPRARALWRFFGIEGTGARARALLFRGLHFSILVGLHEVLYFPR